MREVAGADPQLQPVNGWQGARGRLTFRSPIGNLKSKTPEGCPAPVSLGTFQPLLVRRGLMSGPAVSKSKRTKQDRADESEDGADSQDIQFQGKLHKASLC
jgi:hypothetical protein